MPVLIKFFLNLKKLKIGQDKQKKEKIVELLRKKKTLMRLYMPMPPVVLKKCLNVEKKFLEYMIIVEKEEILILLNVWKNK